MNRSLRRLRIVVLAMLAASCLRAFSAELPVTALADANFIVQDETGQAYSRTTAGLTDDQRALSMRGEAEFVQRWVVPFNVGGHWGRGPLSNGEVCTDCHEGNGRGRAPDRPGMPLQSMLVRLSLPGADQHGGPLPHPVYGVQLQEIGVLGKVPAEGHAYVDYTEFVVLFADGHQARLQQPRVRFRDLNYGPLGDDLMISPRVAPPVFGMGLLEAVPEETLVAIAGKQRELGFDGRPNYVWDAERQKAVAGRFGLKANQPTLRQQIATTYFEDLGVTSSLFPRENCTPPQRMCALVPSGGNPEIVDSRIDALAFYLRTLAVPARRNLDDPTVARGEKLFGQAQCAVCHLPELKTGDYPPLPQISGRVIRPYTDLLLHDMGEGLADGRPDYRAGPRDWRTPPLWGLGLSGKVNGHATFLHDGRARNLAEAVLWHDGEAAGSREAFRNMSKAERDALLAFLGSL